MEVEVEGMSIYLDEAMRNRELKAIRDHTVKLLEERGINEWITCDTCPQASTCEYAFDVYNTYGDCLAEK